MWHGHLGRVFTGWKPMPPSGNPQDGNNNLLRKYIYGPGIDQPVCMIEEAESETYYYHFDALGSVVALSDSSGDTVQTYQYSVFGQVAVEDANHPNPYMFAGRRFDIEIGLYYNRNRYYNPFTGRFLQADPVGYGAGMNLYRYCYNNPVDLRDPSGLDPCDPCDGSTWADLAENTYFVICIDSSASMNPYDVDEIDKAVDMFIQHLADECYGGDTDLAGQYVTKIIFEERNEYAERWLSGMSIPSNNEDPNLGTLRYVNMFFTNEAQPSYYGNTIVSQTNPTRQYKTDYHYLEKEIPYRDFSIGKVFNVGALSTDNTSLPRLFMYYHLHWAFNGHDGYADYDLASYGISYENIGNYNSGLRAKDYLAQVTQL